MKRLINILLHCTILMAALSCVKDGPIDTSVDKITFAPYIPQTKTGFIDDFQKAGYEIKVYDYMKQGNTTGRYMDGVSIVSDADGNWDYKDGPLVLRMVEYGKQYSVHAIIQGTGTYPFDWHNKVHS